MNEQFIKDIQKGIAQEPLNQILPAGSTPRRYEPASGVTKHNHRIHKESKYADTHKNLPFTFRKPAKPKGTSACIRCNNCGHITTGTVATVGMICSACNKFSTVTEVI